MSVPFDDNLRKCSKLGSSAFRTAYSSSLDLNVIPSLENKSPYIPILFNYAMIIHAVLSKVCK